ncbi:hypothetical protein JNUCC64_09055 [Streptomyces sp. JNUCC 64]
MSPVLRSGQSVDAIARWLLSAADDPLTGYAEWTTRDVALLSCGRVFDAVRVPCDLVRVAVSAADDRRASALLHRALEGGPVFLDRYARQVYALTGCGSWPSEGRTPQVEHLGDGCYLGVPRLDLFLSPAARAPESRAFWAGPVVRRDCPVDSLRALVARGLDRLREAEESGR